MSSDRTGIARVVADAAAETREAMGSRIEELQQLELEDPITGEEMLEARQQLGPHAGRIAHLAQARENRRGRPPGSRNKATDDLQRYLLQFGPDPLVGMMRVQGMPTEVLMELSGKSYLECLDRQIRCRESLAPYMHGKQPVRVDATIRTDFKLIEEIVEAGTGRLIEDGEFVELHRNAPPESEAA